MDWIRLAFLWRLASCSCSFTFFLMGSALNGDWRSLLSFYITFICLFRYVDPLGWWNIYLVTRLKTTHKERYKMPILFFYLSFLFIDKSLILHFHGSLGYFLFCSSLVYWKNLDIQRTWFTNFDWGKQFCIWSSPLLNFHSFCNKMVFLRDIESLNQNPHK